MSIFRSTTKTSSTRSNRRNSTNGNQRSHCSLPLTSTLALTFISILISINIQQSICIPVRQELVEGRPSFDKRNVLSRTEARQVYDNFAIVGHVGGKDASSGYGGPAIKALIQMAHFEKATNVLDYGCGQGKLAEFVMKDMLLSPASRSNDANENSDLDSDSDSDSNLNTNYLHWKGVDQSPKMIEKFQERCYCQNSNNNNNNNNNSEFGGNYCTVEYLESGNPSNLIIKDESIDRFVSTYCLDLMSEEDMYKVLDKAATYLHPTDGLLLLVGITWGYKYSIKTCVMTAVWELLYKCNIKKVGGCRPQTLLPYLKARGWRIEEVVHTLPNGFPWMVSEVISARPPLGV